jgi:hypothetical protein
VEEEEEKEEEEEEEEQEEESIIYCGSDKLQQFATRNMFTIYLNAILHNLFIKKT